ncbi:unnamed protein product [Boreogadus saida]
MSCYQSSGKRPLKDPKMGGMDYTVGKERLAEALASGRNLTVVAYGVHLYCGDKSEVKSLFLPAGLRDSGNKVTIDATIQGSSISMIAEVIEPGASPSAGDLQAVWDGAVADLEEQGLLAIETLAQLVQSVAKQLLRQTDKSQASPRMKLWEKMLQLLKETNTRALCATTNKKKLIAEVLGSITPPGEEFNLAQQRKLASMAQGLSSSMLSGEKGNDVETLSLAGSIVNIISYILDSASEASAPTFY